MFTFNLAKLLRKRMHKLSKKERVLALICKRKIQGVIGHNAKTIDTYKNLKSPKNEFKRIHLIGDFVLLFTVDKQKKHIVFVDVLHWDGAYR